MKDIRLLGEYGRRTRDRKRKKSKAWRVGVGSRFDPDRDPDNSFKPEHRRNQCNRLVCYQSRLNIPENGAFSTDAENRPMRLDRGLLDMVLFSNGELYKKLIQPSPASGECGCRLGPRQMDRLVWKRVSLHSLFDRCSVPDGAR